MGGRDHPVQEVLMGLRESRAQKAKKEILDFKEKRATLAHQARAIPDPSDQRYSFLEDYKFLGGKRTVWTERT